MLLWFWEAWGPGEGEGSSVKATPLKGRQDWRSSSVQGVCHHEVPSTLSSAEP